MTRRALIVLAGLGSAALLAGAFAFEHIGGMAPCALCLWQRWPHALAVGLGLVGAVLPAVFVALLGAAAAATTGGLGVYHTGVERGWWPGPSTCSAGGDIGALSTQDLLNQILAAPVVRCDEVAWQMLGLSMASWNAIASFALAGVWLAAAARRG